VRRVGAAAARRSVEAARVWLEHLERAGEASAAAGTALRLARRLQKEGRAEDAFEALARVARRRRRTSPRHLLVRLRAARLATALGRVDEGLDVIGKPRTSQPSWFRTAAHECRAELSVRSGERAAACRELERARRTAVRSGEADFDDTMLSSWRIAVLDARRARLLFELGRRDAARSLLESVLHGAAALSSSLPTGVDPPRAVEALSALAACEIDHGDAERAVELLERALVAARQARGDELLREPLRQLSVHYAAGGRREDAFRLFAEIEAIASRRGDRVGQLQAVYNRAVLTMRGGDLAGAEELFRTARRLSDAMGQHPFSATVWLGLAGVLRERGRALAALRLYRRVLRLPVSIRPGDRVLAHNNLGEIYHSFGRLARSLDERRCAVALARELDRPFLLGVALRNLGSIQLAIGQRDAARRALEESLEIARRATAPRWAGGAAYLLALLADEPQRLTALRAARAECRARGDRPYLADATLAIWTWLVERDRRRLAAARLDRWLGDRDRDGPRRGVVGRALRLRADPAWPANAAALTDLLRRAEEDGARWQVFQALGAALDDPALPPALRDRYAEWREVLAVRSARDLASEDLASFRREWRLAAEADAAPERPQPDAPPERSSCRLSWGEAMLEWIEDEAADPVAAAARVLDALRETVGAREARVWCPDEPDGGLFQSVEPAVALSPALARLVDAARSRGGVLLSAEDDAVVRLRTAAFACLCVRGFVTRDSLPGAMEHVVGAAAALSLLARLCETRQRHDDERRRTLQARGEVRRLRRAMARDRGELDTELISRRSGLLEAARARGEAGTTGRVPVAESRAMRDILSRLPRIAEGDIPVLLLGESGVGKDYLASWIHHLSARRDQPLLAEACVLPETLLESELFGYVRGAFTGAESDRAGLFERVAGGTLYLDEIADLPQHLQSRLLRVLQDRCVRPLGAAETVTVDFRLIASSRVGSVDELRARGLREDLFYRIGGEIVTLPPLRERLDDLEALVTALVAGWAAAHGRRPADVPAESLAKLAEHSWPGNIRELDNEVRRALLQDPNVLRAEHLLASGPIRRVSGFAGADAVAKGFRVARDEFERDLIAEALRQHAGNASHAAETLGISRRYLGKLLDKHGLELGRGAPAERSSPKRRSRARAKKKPAR